MPHLERRFRGNRRCRPAPEAAAARATPERAGREQAARDRRARQQHDATAIAIRGGSYDESTTTTGVARATRAATPTTAAPAGRRRSDLDVKAVPWEDRADHVRCWGVATMLSISFFEKNLIRVGNILSVGRADRRRAGAGFPRVGPRRGGALVFAFGFFLILSGGRCGNHVERSGSWSRPGTCSRAGRHAAGGCPSARRWPRAGILEAAAARTGACPCRRLKMVGNAVHEGDAAWPPAARSARASVMEARARCNRRSMTPCGRGGQILLMKGRPVSTTCVEIGSEGGGAREEHRAAASFRRPLTSADRVSSATCPVLPFP